MPYPPNYGGVIDVFYKIKSLYELGCEVTLHCFEYGRGKQSDLDKYCKKVFYYPRHKNIFKFLSPLPYIVNTRNDASLIKNLKADNHPILFEGLHSCFFLQDTELRKRFKIVRTHNIEHDYYQSLARSENRLFQKLYFYNEAKRLKVFEDQLKYADLVAAISANDAYHFRRKYTGVEIIFAFHPFEKVISIPGSGNFTLYHGNLAVAENNVAALYLVKEVFKNLEIPLYIAGSNPSTELIDAAKQNSCVKIFANIDTQGINELVAEAHINILPTFQATGIKLKLLAALYSGRHCIVNTPMVANTGLESLCIIKETAREMQNEIKNLMKISFTVSDIQKRREILEQHFSNQNGARKLLDLIP